MNLLSKKNFLLLLAGVLVIAFGLMSLYLNDQKAMREREALQTQQEAMQPAMSNSDSVSEIEKDLDNTDLESVDKELQDMEEEINSSF